MKYNNLLFYAEVTSQIKTVYIKTFTKKGGLGFNERTKKKLHFKDRKLFLSVCLKILLRENGVGFR